MWSVAESVSRFAWKNRGKLTIALAVGIGVAAYYHYSSSSSDKDRRISNANSRNEVLLEGNGGQASSSREKSRLLYRARKQFDIVCIQFLSTLRGRIVDVVDLSSAIRQIKELRSATASQNSSKTSSSSAGSTDSSSDMEMRLWEDIKIGSFTQLFVTAYALAAICVLLRVQMHILARSSDSFTNIQSETLSMNNTQHTTRTHDFGIAGDYDDDISAVPNSHTPSQQPSNDAFKQLIDGTYKHIFSTGLRSLSSIVRQQVSSNLRDWKVKEKAVVEYGELVQALSQIRRSIESDVANLIKIMIIRKFIAYFMSIVSV
jgi:hypothetical protein